MCGGGATINSAAKKIGRQLFYQTHKIKLKVFFHKTILYFYNIIVTVSSSRSIISKKNYIKFEWKKRYKQKRRKMRVGRKKKEAGGGGGLFFVWQKRREARPTCAFCSFLLTTALTVSVFWLLIFWMTRHPMAFQNFKPLFRYQNWHVSKNFLHHWICLQKTYRTVYSKLQKLSVAILTSLVSYFLCRERKILYLEKVCSKN